MFADSCDSALIDNCNIAAVTSCAAVAANGYRAARTTARTTSATDTLDIKPVRTIADRAHLTCGINIETCTDLAMIGDNYPAAITAVRSTSTNG